MPDQTNTVYVLAAQATEWQSSPRRWLLVATRARFGIFAVRTNQKPVLTQHRPEQVITQLEGGDLASGAATVANSNRQKAKLTGRGSTTREAE